MAPRRIRPWRLAAPALAALAALTTGPAARVAWASDPVGIYSLVEDVRLEADPAAPDQEQRIRVYGYHSLAYRVQSGEQRGWGLYTTPAAGYLYFRCPPGAADTCALEWRDLLAADGDERCAAYGHRYLTDPEPNGKLRDPADPAAAELAPDSYPIGQGVLLVREGERGTCAELRAERDRQAGLATPEPGATPTATAAAGSPEPDPKPSEVATQGSPERKPTVGKAPFDLGQALLLPALVPGGPAREAGRGEGSGDATSPAPAAPPGRPLLGGSALALLGAAFWLGRRRPPGR